jgi:hypothetical protein
VVDHDKIDPVLELEHVCVVIDRKRKTNIRQENAAEYSADNEYSAQGSKHLKNVNLCKEKIVGRQLQVAFDGHDLWATCNMHRTQTLSTKS